MPVDIPTEPSREPVASYRTAIPCLLRLAALHGSKSDLSAALHGDARDTEFVPISRVIELAGEFGLQATHTQLDWQGLENTAVGHPILVLLNNTNLVILNESERGGAAEVAIWDPLHPGGQVFSVPRSNFEKAWTGHVLIITPPAAAGEEAPPAGMAWFTSATRTPTVPNLAPGNGSAAGHGIERNRDQTPQGIPLASLQADDPTEWLNAQRSRPASEAGASAPAASAAARASGSFGRRLWLGALIAVTVASFAIFAVTLLTRISAISSARHPVQETAATEKPSAAGAGSTATPIDSPAPSAARPGALSTAATPGATASTAAEPAPTPTAPPPSDTVATVAPAAAPETARSEASPGPSAPTPTAPPPSDTIATVAPAAPEAATSEASPGPLAPTPTAPPPSDTVATVAPAAPEAATSEASPGPPAPTPTAPPPSDMVATVASAAPEAATSQATPRRPPAPTPTAPPPSDTDATVAPPASEPAAGEASPRLPALVAPPEKTGPLLTSPPSPPAASAAAPASPTRQPPSIVAGGARPPAVPPLSTAALVARGDGFLRTGDVASARLFYERAVDAGDGQAALRLGETFDPAFLQAAHLAQIHGDMATAVSWYRRARDLGVREADVLLRGATK